MSYQDQVLVCVECGEEFDFSASEQEFFDSKGLTTPRRCKDCRKARRRRKGPRQGGGEYRSPAFADSAPEHQGGRGPGRGPRHGKPGRDRGEYRSPAFRESKPGDRGMYRSPAFREQSYDDEYRAPGFRESDWQDAQSEYRAPGFREFESRDGQSDYRAPGFQEHREPSGDDRGIAGARPSKRPGGVDRDEEEESSEE